jgi:hypothetical protein
VQQAPPGCKGRLVADSAPTPPRRASGAHRARISSSDVKCVRPRSVAGRVECAREPHPSRRRSPGTRADSTECSIGDASSNSAVRTYDPVPSANLSRITSRARRSRKPREDRRGVRREPHGQGLGQMRGCDGEREEVTAVQGETRPRPVAPPLDHLCGIAGPREYAPPTQAPYLANSGVCFDPASRPHRRSSDRVAMHAAILRQHSEFAQRRRQCDVRRGRETRIRGPTDTIEDVLWRTTLPSRRREANRARSACGRLVQRSPGCSTSDAARHQARAGTR